MGDCTICQSTQTQPQYTGTAYRPGWQDGKLWKVQHCRTCGHGFVCPQPDQQTLTGYYNKGYAPYSDLHGIKTNLDAVVSQARATGRHRHVALHPDLRLLDVGCGGGSFLRVASALGVKVQGVEPSQHGIDSCRAHDIPAFHGMLSDFLEVTDTQYDLITANHVMEHHPDPVRLLGEMQQLLSPKGQIWISVPNAGCFLARGLKDRWHSADLPVHLQHFTHQSLKRAFFEAGLQVIDCSTRSDGSLGASIALYLRTRFLVPGRITRNLLARPLAAGSAVERWVDGRGQGEALLISGQMT